MFLFLLYSFEEHSLPNVEKLCRDNYQDPFKLTCKKTDNMTCPFGLVFYFAIRNKSSIARTTLLVNLNQIPIVGATRNIFETMSHY